MNKAAPKLKIGVVSGVGPLAGAYVLERVVKASAIKHGAVEDWEYPDMFLVSHGIKGVGNEADLTGAFKQEMINSVKQVEAQGAQCIGIACNTAHVFFDDITAATEVKVINLIDEVALHAAESKEKYLLLSSRSSRDQELHVPALKREGVDFTLTNELQQRVLDEVIELVMGYHLHEAASKLDEILLEAHKAGLSGIIAACTEIPLALRHSHNEHKLVIVDSNQTLADALVRESYN